MQIIVGGVASTPQDVTLYASCSLLAASMKCDGKKASNEATNKGAIEACVEWLIDNEFISIQRDEQGTTTLVLYFSCSKSIIHLHLTYDEMLAKHVTTGAKVFLLNSDENKF